LLGLPVLRWIIQQGGATLQDILTRVDRGREALGTVREFAEKGMKQLTQSTAAGREHRVAGGGGRRLLNEILELPQKQIEQLQHRIDAQVRASLDRLTAHPTVQNELRRIEQSVKALERQLHRFRRAERRRGPPRRPKRGVASKGAGR